MKRAISDWCRPRTRIGGPGTSIIMAAFTHLNPEGGRFSDGSYGVLYAAGDLDTAIAETKHHRARFMRATEQSRMELDMRAYAIDLDGDLHDLRGRRAAFPLVYRHDDYAAAQHLAKTLREDGSNGTRATTACAATAANARRSSARRSCPTPGSSSPVLRLGRS